MGIKLLPLEGYCMISNWIIVLSHIDELNPILKKSAHYFKDFTPSAIFIQQQDAWFQDILQRHQDDAASHSTAVVKEQLSDSNYPIDIPILSIHGDVSHLFSKLALTASKTVMIAKKDESTEQTLIEHSACSVLLLNASTATQEKVIIPVDLSQASDSTVDFAQTFAEASTIELLYVEHIEFGPMDNLFDIQEPTFNMAQNELMRKTQEELFELFRQKHQLKGTLITQFATPQSDIANYINEQHASLAILAQHDKTLFIDESITYAIAPLLQCDVIILKSH